MRASAVEEVMRELGSYNPVPKVNSKGDYGALSCPLAPWTHGGGRDANPSMMVSLDEGMTQATCLSCGHNSSLKSLVWEVYKHGGIDEEKAEDLSYFVTLQAASHFKQLEVEGYIAPIDSELVGDLNKPHKYWLEERKLSKGAVREWGLGFSWEKMRGLIPFWDMSGTLVAILGRDVTGKADKKYMIYPSGFDRNKYLFGEHRITGKERAVLLVEGYLDAITASMYLPEDVGVVALGSAHLSKEQGRRLAQLTNHVYLALDSDSAGQMGMAKARRLLGAKVRLTELDLGWYKDIDDVGAELPNVLSEGREAVYAPVADSLKRLMKREPPKRLVDKGSTTVVKWGVSNE